MEMLTKHTLAGFTRDLLNVHEKTPRHFQCFHYQVINCIIEQALLNTFAIVQTAYDYAFLAF